MQDGWTNVSPMSQQVTINGADMPNINFTNQPPSPTVTPVLTTITVSPSTATLNVTETQLFTATALDQNNTPMSGINISWTISNSTVGSVTPLFAVTGMDGNATTAFTASAAGTATVTATNGTVSGSADVTVAAVTPTLTPTPIVTLTPTPVSTFSITGTVFIDDNQDTLQDGVEKGYAGATLTLALSDGSYAQKTTTDANGHYSFTNVLGDTAYILRLTVPAGYRAEISDQEAVTLTGDLTGQDFPIVSTTPIPPTLEQQKEAARNAIPGLIELKISYEALAKVTCSALPSGFSDACELAYKPFIDYLDGAIQRLQKIANDP